MMTISLDELKQIRERYASFYYENLPYESVEFYKIDIREMLERIFEDDKEEIKKIYTRIRDYQLYELRKIHFHLLEVLALGKPLNMQKFYKKKEVM